MDDSGMDTRLNFLSHFLLVVSYPLGLYFHQYFENFPINDSMDVRIGISIFCIFIYTISLIDYVSKFVPMLFHVLHVITLFYSCYLSYQNYLGFTYTIGLAVIVGNIIYANKSINFIRFYFVLILLSTLLVSYTVQSAVLNSWVFFIAISISAFFALISHSSELLLIEKLNLEKERANKANQEKTIFLARMSHEIRNPLNAIIPIIDLLEAEKSPVEQRQYISTISQSSKLLLNIVNDTLDLSKIEAGKMELHLQPSDPYTIAEDCYHLYQTKAKEKSINFEFRFKGIRKMYQADSLRIQQILLNLLGNAIKFTSQGSVLLELESSEEGSYLKTIFKVFDTGMGIPREHQEKIFQQYYQIQEKERTQIKGTGLGLYICWKLTELMQGILSFQSPPSGYQEGTVFLLELKFPIVEMEKAVKPIHEMFSKSVSKALLVDDDPINLLVLTRYLKNLQIEVKSMTNPIEAIELAKSEFFPLVLLDVEMPEMNGYQVAEAITQLGSLSRDAKIIAVSGHDANLEINYIHNTRIDKFLMKPIRSEDLYQSIKELFNDQSS
jgi:signal transduction histidine kinase/ActR/RegA family two-component response regulator